jgi:hypothetical protein
MYSVWRWGPRYLALAVTLLYCCVCPAGFYWLDSAELSASAVGLGSPHPTGFPLYCVLGKLASLIPVGELAFRLNLLSAICAGLAVLGVARLVQCTGEKDWATALGALAAGLTLAFSVVFVRQATVAEVYAPTAALLVLAMLLFVKVAQGGDARVGLSLALVAGLGIGAHGSFRLLLGLPIAALLLVRLQRGARWPLLAPLVAVVGAGALHLYLPVRSAAEGAALLDWGHPRTLGALFEHINASAIRDAYAQEMLSTTTSRVFADASMFAEQLGGQLGLLCLVAALGGAALLWRERTQRWVAALLCTVALGDLFYGVWLNPMGLKDLQNGVPFALAACALAGVGVAGLAKLMGRGAPFVAAFAAVVLATQPALVSLDSLEDVGDLPRDYVESALLSAPGGAILVSQSDSLAAGALFLTAVEGARPDVATVVAQRAGDLATTGAALAPSGPIALDPGAPLLSMLASGRPVLWEPGDLSAPGRMQRAVGPVVAQMIPEETPVDPGDVDRARRQLAMIFEHPGTRDRVALLMRARALTQLGRMALLRRDPPLAVALFVEALKHRPQHVAAAVNLGSVWASLRRFREAAEVTELALSHEPKHVVALINAGRYRFQLGEYDAARAHCERAMELAPDNSTAYSLCGVVAAQSRDFARARPLLERALQLWPENREAKAALKKLEKLESGGHSPSF